MELVYSVDEWPGIKTEIHPLFFFFLSRLQTWTLLYILRQISQIQSHGQHPHLSYPHTPNLVTKSSNYSLKFFYLDPLSLLLYSSHYCCLIYCYSALFYLFSVVPPSRTIHHLSSFCGAVAWFLYPQHSITQEFAGNANSWVPPQFYTVRNWGRDPAICVPTSSLSDDCTC